MQTRDLLFETERSLTANPMRTILTMLGIVIGIASVIVMMSIGQGAQSSIQSRINALGSNVLTIMQGGGARRGEVSGGANSAQLTRGDAEAIAAKIPTVVLVAPAVSARAQASAEGNNSNSSIDGVTPSYQQVRAVELEEGIFITEHHDSAGSRVAVLGPIVRDTLFGAGARAVGKKIKISANTYTVIGVMASKGGSGMGSVDERIMVPLKTAQFYLTGNTSLQSISVSTGTAEDLASAQQDILQLLAVRHKIKNVDLLPFRALNQADLAATMASVTQIFTILLSSIAGISLVVGGIGIMNMMLTTVRERTREIGLRKALGAQKKDISTQFLVESIVVTSIGGVIGIVLGYGLSSLVTYSGMLTATTPLYAVVLSFSVAAFIGVVFGYYPAKKAAELNPIDALRYE
jgi:putative ABC transport system permease protein